MNKNKRIKLYDDIFIIDGKTVGITKATIRTGYQKNDKYVRFLTNCSLGNGVMAEFDLSLEDADTLISNIEDGNITYVVAEPTGGVARLVDYGDIHFGIREHINDMINTSLG